MGKITNSSAKSPKTAPAGASYKGEKTKGGYGRQKLSSVSKMCKGKGKDG